MEEKKITPEEFNQALEKEGLFLGGQNREGIWETRIWLKWRPLTENLLEHVIEGCKTGGWLVTGEMKDGKLVDTLCGVRTECWDGLIYTSLNISRKKEKNLITSSCIKVSPHNGRRKRKKKKTEY